MIDPVYDELLRLSSKRELDADDRARIEACLAAHPEFRDQWNEDVRLGRLLGAVQDVPVSSNFSSRVMDAIDRSERSNAESLPWWRKLLPTLTPRVGWSVALAAAVLLGGWQLQQQHKERTEARARVRFISDLAAARVAPDVFRDFEAINQLRYVPTVSDDELLTVLAQ